MRRRQNQIELIVRKAASIKLTEELDATSSVATEVETSPLRKPKKSNKEDKPKKFSWPVYKKLLRYAYKQWKLFIISIFTLIGSSLLTSLLPYMVGVLLDDISKPGNEKKLNTNHMEMLYVLLGLSVVTYIRVIVTDYLQQKISISIRVDVFSSFIKNDIYFFEMYKTGEINSRLGSDINQAKSAVSNNITFLLRNMMTIIGNIFVLMAMSWKLTLLVLVIVPIYGIVTIIHNRKTKKYMRQIQDIVAEGSSHVNEVFSGIQVVKAFSGEQKEIDTYDRICNKARSTAFLKSLYSGMYITSSVLLPNIGVLLVLWYGGNLVMSGAADLTAGQLTSYIMYCTTLSNNASAISNSYSNIINGTSAVQKVFEMMEYEPQINEKDGKGATKEFKGEIEMVNIGFRYPKGEVQILKGLNLHIRKGEYVAFVGQSGSGKSTIVKLIERFYEPQFGSIYFDDVNAKDLSIKCIRQQIGFVGQDAILFSGSIEENITYGVKDYKYDELVEVCEKTGCMEFIGNVSLFPQGFKTLVGEKGCQLSGGQRQRVSIARALIKKPKILIFDEATSALDSNSEFIVQQSIEKLVQDQSKKLTIIIIAHRLSTVINAQRIFVMKQGEIVEEGSHADLIENSGYYSELVAKQMQTKTSFSSSRSLSPTKQ